MDQVEALGHSAHADASSFDRRLCQPCTCASGARTGHRSLLRLAAQQELLCPNASCLGCSQSVRSSLSLHIDMAFAGEARRMCLSGDLGNVEKGKSMSLSRFRTYRASKPDHFHMWLSLAGWFMMFVVGVTIPSEPFRTAIVGVAYDLALPASMPGSSRPSSASGLSSPQLSSGVGTENLWMPVQDEAARSDADRSQLSKPAQRSLGSRALLALFSIPAVAVTFTPLNLAILCCFAGALGSYASRVPDLVKDAPSRSPGVPCVRAMLHGLLVFAGAVAGLIVIQGDFKWDQQQGDLYLRLAATVTLLSIAAGTNPNFVADIAKVFMPLRGSDVRKEPPTT